MLRGVWRAVDDLALVEEEQRLRRADAQLGGQGAAQPEEDLRRAGATLTALHAPTRSTPPPTGAAPTLRQSLLLRSAGAGPLSVPFALLICACQPHN